MADDSGLLAKLRHVFRGFGPDPLPPSDAEEPCGACGEETAPGTIRYSDRHEFNAEDGARLYLCADCSARARAAKGGEPVTDADMRVIAGNGGMIGVGFLAGGH